MDSAALFRMRAFGAGAGVCATAGSRSILFCMPNRFRCCRLCACCPASKPAVERRGVCGRRDGFEYAFPFRRAVFSPVAVSDRRFGTKEGERPCASARSLVGKRIREQVPVRFACRRSEGENPRIGCGGTFRKPWKTVGPGALPRREASGPVFGRSGYRRRETTAKEAAGVRSIRNSAKIRRCRARCSCCR